jgi:peptidoglycan L-alanyl-D-glutamate endopeptidase CwlK
LLDADAKDGSSTTRNKALSKLLLASQTSDQIISGDVTTVTKGPDGKPPLTPINAALGQTVGKALNGKKSVSGVAGLLLTVLLPKLGMSGDIVEFAATNSTTLVTLFSLVTGWGMFGKLDKAIRLVGMMSGAK